MNGPVQEKPAPVVTAHPPSRESLLRALRWVKAQASIHQQAEEEPKHD